MKPAPTPRFVFLRLLALISSWLTGPSLGQQSTSTDFRFPLAALPGDVDMSAERLERIDHMCQAAVEDSQVPGIVALVARHGRIVYHKAFGMADSQAGRELERDDIFRVASQSKAITSTAVMILWEEGRFQLDDPVSKFIPEFKNTGVLKTFNEQDITWTTEPVNTPITIRHLLNHTSGLGYGVIDGDVSDSHS